MRKIEHIGIAVANLDEANKLYEALLGTPPYKQEMIESEQVITSFFRNGPEKIELVAPTNENSVIAKFIAKKGPGLHHIAFDVPDILSEMDRLKKLGFRLINEKPKKGADNKLICFLHPKSTDGVLIELCQEITE